MAYTPQFPTFTPPTFPPTNPLLVANPSILSTFFTKKNLINQKEIYSKTIQNVGFVDASFQSALKQVGWKEATKTSKGTVDGLAWCAYFVKLCFMQLYSFDREWLAKKFTGGAINNLRTIQALNSAKDYRWVASTNNDPQVGDGFALKMQNGGHTGIIIEVIKQNADNSWDVTTVEGNTNAGQSREGDKSMSLKRKLLIGGKTGGGILLGYFRRNFTEAEKQMLAFDDVNQTFIFKEANNSALGNLFNLNK